ncbi:MAG: HipA N-terminal domain-containing protein [Bacteroidales bacterium]|nr:HipA N-terminal domain-containing protein [Bacteroidales bacterium]
MINFADVYIWGQQVGTVAWDANRQAGSFEYSSAFTGTGLELSPLMMPVISNNVYEFSSLPTETFIGLPGLLADALPDTFGKALLDRWLTMQGR